MVVNDITEDKVENTTSDKGGKDITGEVEVDADEVDMYSIEDLAPSSYPMTIPYLEIYRTNELEYVPYISPYNVGVSSSSDTDTSSDTSTTDTNTDGTDMGTDTDTNTNGTDTNTDTGSNSSTNP